MSVRVGLPKRRADTHTGRRSREQNTDQKRRRWWWWLSVGGYRRGAEETSESESGVVVGSASKQQRRKAIEWIWKKKIGYNLNASLINKFLIKRKTKEGVGGARAGFRTHGLMVNIVSLYQYVSSLTSYAKLIFFLFELGASAHRRPKVAPPLPQAAEKGGESAGGVCVWMVRDFWAQCLRGRGVSFGEFWMKITHTFNLQNL